MPSASLLLLCVSWSSYTFFRLMFLELLRPGDIAAFEKGWKNEDANFKQRAIRSSREMLQYQWRAANSLEKREKLAPKLQEAMEEEDRAWRDFAGYVSWKWRRLAEDPIANVVFFPFPPWPGCKVSSALHYLPVQS